VKPKLGSGDRDEALTGLLANLSPEGIGPQWIRSRPPRLPIQDGEVRAFYCQVFDCLEELFFFSLNFSNSFPVSVAQPR